jgi:hypothetical protein
MNYIIDVDVKTPFLRPNYNYIIDLMEQEGAVMLLHDRAEVKNIHSCIKNSDYQFGAVRISEDTWKVYLKEKKKKAKIGLQYDIESFPEEYAKKLKLLEQGNKVSFLNRGQTVFFMGVYKKHYPEESRKFKMKKNESDYSLWLEKIG